MKKFKLISICFAASLLLWSCTAANSNISNQITKVQSSLTNQKKVTYAVSRGKRVDQSQTPDSGMHKSVEVIKAEKPKVTIAKIEKPKAKVLKAEVSKAEMPKAEISKAEISKAEISKAETPKAETPKAETPKAEIPKAEKPKPEAASVKPITEHLDPVVVKEPEAAKPAQKEDNLEGAIKITGSTTFMKQVQDALNLLKEKDLATYNRVNKYLNKIVENQNSGVDVYSKTFFLGKGTVSEGDVYWLAGVIVHDAYHSELFSLNKPYTGAEAEDACIQQQKTALKNIGAPDNYLSYLDEVSKSQYWEVPFEQRGW